MTQSKYKIIPLNQNHPEEDEDDGEEYTDNLDDDDTVTIVPSTDTDNVQFLNKFNPNNNNNAMQTPIAILSLILIYFSLSIGLTFYQRSLLRSFHFPFAVVLYHLILKLVIAAILRFTYICFTGKTRVHVDWKKSFKKLAPTGVAAGIDIGFSNWGLELVTISLYTMTKSSTIIFILFFAILFGLERKSWSLMAIVILISSGLCLFTYKSTQFNMLGFIFLMIASITSGIRWTFAQFIMQKSKLGLHNPIDMIYFMQPWMILPILPLTIGFEGEALIKLPESSPSGTFETEGIILAIKITAGAFLAFAMEVSEFLLLSHTSSLTLSISGIFKEICLLILAVEYEGDQMSIINMMGLAMCLSGIACHIVHKFSLIKPMQNIPVISDSGSMVSPTSFEHHLHQVNSVNTANGGTAKQTMKLNYFSNQHTPLLDSTDDAMHSDSDDSQNHQNASEVIFDVLKRRDMRR